MGWVLRVSQFLIRLLFASGVGVFQMRIVLSRSKLFVGSTDKKKGVCLLGRWERGEGLCWVVENSKELGLGSYEN